MFKVLKIDHIAVAVPSIDDALAKWREVFGLEAEVRELVAAQRTEAALLPIGETSIELIEPKGNDGLAKFLEKRGPGLHHVAIEVDDLDAALALLASLGVPLLDPVARRGARGHKVAFVHPKATGGVLVELCEPEQHDRVAADPAV